MVVNVILSHTAANGSMVIKMNWELLVRKSPEMNPESGKDESGFRNNDGTK
jgi:hypothetical protein